MSTPRRLPFGLVRIGNFLALLLKSRLAIAGLILLVLFIIGAFAAPFLTPYHPTEVVAASFVPPSWVGSLYGSASYSQNIEFSGITSFTNSTGVVLNLDSRALGPDTMDINVSSVSGGTILIAKTMHYPYTASPKEFEGSAGVFPISGVNASVSPQVVVFVERKGVAQYGPLWNTSLVRSLTQYHRELSSSDTSLVQRLGFPFGTDTNKVVFPGKGDYLFVMMISLPSGPFQAHLKVTNFSLKLYGNTFGLLGTDFSGSDIFAQLLYGSQLSLVVGLVATGIGVSLGLVIGLLAGFLGKIVDEILMRFTDMMLVIPSLPLLIVLATVLGTSLTNIIIILGFLGWMGFARLVRSQVLSLRERPFIEAAKASGAGTGYILSKHIFPNIVGLTYVNLALSVPTAIVGEAALSFLGLGDPNAITWGHMLELASGNTGSLAWWWVIPPGLGIALLSLSFILVGYSLDELFNPKLRKRR